MIQLITISKLAKATEVTKGTLRYYEAIGLIPKPQRSESGYRLYSENDVRRVQLIKQAKELGINLIREEKTVLERSPCSCLKEKGGK